MSTADLEQEINHMIERVRPHISAAELKIIKNRVSQFTSQAKPVPQDHSPPIDQLLRPNATPVPIPDQFFKLHHRYE